MSRQLPPSKRPRVPPTPDNPYQPTTASTLPLPHNHVTAKDSSYHLRCTGSVRGAPCHRDLDACFTDEAFNDHSYYDFYDENHDHGYQTSPNRFRGDGSSRSDVSRTDDDDDSDGASRIQYTEYDEISERRLSRSNHQEARQAVHVTQTGRDMRRVYPNQDDVQRCLTDQSIVAMPASFSTRGHLSRMSGGSRQSGGSDGPSAMVHGCGGKCPTFENVCYYFLQVAFTMGILIGVSLGIAGWVLRKSAARNLQVLLYIGAMLSLVCALLLAVQCSARNSARMRQKVLRNAKRAPIQMDTLGQPGAFQQQLPLIQNTATVQSFRGVPVTLVQVPGPALQVQRPYDRRTQIIEQPGIPWWRRKDLN